MQYIKSNLQLEGIYRLSIPPGIKSIEKTTMEGVCGFVFPIKGKAKFTICKQEYLLEVGTILHAGSKMELCKEVIGDENWEFILVHYKVLQEENNKESLLRMHYMLKIFSDRNREVMLILEKLIQLQKEPGFKNALSSKAMLYEMVAKLLNFSEERSDHQQKDPIDEVLDCIHENLDKNLNIAGLAEQFAMDAKQFYYLFRKKVGISPKKYILNYQMKRAKELIIENDLSMMEVSAKVGFDDSLHFSRIFKQHVGLSPTAFRNQFRKNP